MRFLTTGEIASVLQVTIPTVKRWIRDGHLSAFRTAGGHYRVSESELGRFRATHRMPDTAGEPLRILVVDDDPHFRDAVTEALGLDARFHVEAASDGYEALIKIGTYRPQLLVLDLVMPGLDGYEVCRKVKADPVTNSTRILAVTGYAEGSARDRILEAGADAWLEKPVRLEALHAEAARLLGVATLSPESSPFPVDSGRGGEHS
jgi:excisionase family DNA binding protein